MGGVADGAVCSVCPGTKRDPSEVVKTRSSLYMLAAARDGINEMHPEILERRMQVNKALGFKLVNRPLSTAPNPGVDRCWRTS
jgi:hypothetical protein